MRQDQPGENRNSARMDPRPAVTAACAGDVRVHGAGGFGPGTLIATDQGDVPVEWLAAGDRVLTRDQGYQPLVRVARRRFAPAHFRHHPEDCPVRVPAGTLAPCVPERDLHVSGQHRLFVRAPNARPFAGQSEVLTQAHAWADLGLAEEIDPAVAYTFTRLFCAAHQIIHAQGAWVESCLPGPGALAAFDGPAQQKETPLWRGPAEAMVPARLCLTRREAYAVIHGARDSRFSTFPDTVLKRA